MPLTDCRFSPLVPRVISRIYVLLDCNETVRERFANSSSGQFSSRDVNEVKAWFPAKRNARVARNASKMLSYNLTQAVCL